MDKEQLINELKVIIEGYLKEKNLELVELVCRREARGLVVRILVDRPEGGINLGECASLNRGIGNLFDEKEILQEGYILEVFSPGLDRPLAAKNDFLRALNKKAKFFLNEGIEGKLEIDAVIVGVDNEGIQVNASGREINIPLAKINKAKQLI